MAYTDPKTVTTSWPASPQYTVNERTPIIIRNDGSTRLYWATRFDSVQVGLSVTQGVPIEADDYWAMTLEPGEFLSLAWASGGSGNIIIHHGDRD